MVPDYRLPPCPRILPEPVPKGLTQVFFNSWQPCQDVEEGTFSPLANLPSTPWPGGLSQAPLQLQLARQPVACAACGCGAWKTIEVLENECFKKGGLLPLTISFVFSHKSCLQAHTVLIASPSHCKYITSLVCSCLRCICRTGSTSVEDSRRSYVPAVLSALLQKLSAVHNICFVLTLTRIQVH
jgi:hypothetical protein